MEFTTRLYCHNCGNHHNAKFPYGTKLTKRRVYTKGTTARIPIDKAPGWEDEQVTCPWCGSDRVT